MIRFAAILSFIFYISLNAIGQTSIEVIESTFKIKANSEETLYYGFAAGDKIVLSVEEVDGKELKQIEVIEYPSSSRFKDYKTAKISAKQISVSNTGVYKFVFTNTAIIARLCKVKIARIPESEKTKSFNTTVYWKNLSDTIYLNSKEKYVMKSDTTIVSLVDQVAKVSSKHSINGNTNKTVVDFTLPENTVSWAYYIGVGHKGKKEMSRAVDRFVGTAVSLASSLSGYGTLAALAMYGYSTFQNAQGGDNVKYWFINNDKNLELFKSDKTFESFKQGDVINDAAQMKSPLSGHVFFGLMNDNTIEAIEVVVKVTAITVKLTYGERNARVIKTNGRQQPYLKN